MSTLKSLIVILGPTASGKTEMGLRLAKKFDGEIVNADSRQIYEDMLIATGSPILENQELSRWFHSPEGLWNLNAKHKSATQMQKGSTVPRRELWSQRNVRNGNAILINNIPHRLFHFIKPDQKFSVAEYKDLAINIIRDIHNRNKIPILVGGTGLYISSIVDNLEIPKAAPNEKIRNKLEKHTEKYLFNKLKKVDSKSAEIIGPHNKRKLVRALEVFELTGKPFSAQQIKGEPLFDCLQIGIKIDREKLYEKIDKRIDKMIKLGLIEETKKLHKKYSFDLPAMSGIGYSEINKYLKNEIGLDEAAQKIKFRTHHYARRQMTWFKRDGRIWWFEDYREAEELINRFLKNNIC